MGVALKDIFKFCAPHDKAIVPSQYYLRLIGLLCCCIAVIEFGLGGRTSTYLANVNNGSWWSTIAVFLAGACAMVGLNKAWVKAACLLSSFGILTALVGAIVDGMSRSLFKDLISCGTVPTGHTVTSDPASFQSHLVIYGDSKGFVDISYCMASYEMLNQFAFGKCYCVTDKGGFCGDYSLSKSALSLQANCGNVLTTYTRNLAASFSFCCIASFCVFVLFAFTTFLLCSQRFFTIETARELFPLTHPEEPQSDGPRKVSEFELGIIDKEKKRNHCADDEA